MMNESVVLYEVRDRIAYITLNRPKKLNAFNLELSAALRDTWDRFENDTDAQVAILSANGKSFSAGVDLTDEDRKTATAWQYHEAYPRNGIKVFKPIVGAIHGYALGQGYILAVTGCDITIAAESAVFGYPESRAGVSQIPPQYTPYMPFKINLEFMLLSWKGGRLMNAKRAYEVGLVNQVVLDAELMDEAVKWAELLMEIPPLFIKSVKHGYYTQTERKSTMDEREYIDYILPQEVSRDKQEAINAFMEKRAPRFTGK
ncbi:enoyl-CoA hydratase/isomerase family protein [Thermodesulfobacteriota bacterium]